MSEKFNLIWQTFPLHGKNLFQQLMETGKYSDVTLVSDDQHIFKAHKFVLSSCSTFFETIFDNNPNNTSVYLRGVNQEELNSILQFIYLGKTTLFQERMNLFMNVAKDLKIKEIGENAVDDNDDEAVNSKNEIVVNEHVFIKQESTSDLTHNIREDTSKYYKISLNDENKYACEKCDYKTTIKRDLVRHVQGIHEGIKFPCTYCNNEFNMLNNLRRHIKSKHTNTK